MWNLHLYSHIAHRLQLERAHTYLLPHLLTYKLVSYLDTTQCQVLTLESLSHTCLNQTQRYNSHRTNCYFLYNSTNKLVHHHSEGLFYTLKLRPHNNTENSTWKKTTLPFLLSLGGDVLLTGYCHTYTFRMGSRLGKSCLRGQRRLE